ncbi:LAMI_0F15346g1_1 [Lachancea mirantina]|uniref:LAMI_0F15346g1_1 n=1 Tax=Lachancea mirantina TaxID=1230905 RepID=A0A1G4K4A9_9SACH|nr:LAMI_0F15346g1_1 [Lachancea mirantina]
MQLILAIFWVFLAAYKSQAEEIQSSLLTVETSNSSDIDGAVVDAHVNKNNLIGSLQYFQGNEKILYPFNEELTIRPLPRNFLLTSFLFQLESNEVTKPELDSEFNSYKHYTVFPKALSPILDRTQTRQLHLRFTHGLWDAEEWGQLPRQGYTSGGNGVEMWAVIEAPDQKAAFQQWISLANSLSGLFCSSLNFIGSEKTTYPVFSFLPESQIEPFFDVSNGLFLIRAALANEPICTENLTPFLKLLPTKGKSGISSLLDGHKVFDSQWHSMSIDIESKCDEFSCKYEMNEQIEMVFHLPNTLSRADRPIPKPLASDELRCDESKPHDDYQCFPLPESRNLKFDLSKLFGKSISGTNLVSETPSRICAVVAPNWNVLIRVGDTFFSTSDNCFDISDNNFQDMVFETDDTSQIIPLEPAPFFASRSLTGYSQDAGGMRTVIKNPTNDTINIFYFESLPWFLRLYLSSLKLESDSGLLLRDVIQDTFYSPAVDRQRPSHLEFNLSIPANTSIALSFEFDKVLLKYAEYPPDANHGFEIESAVLSVMSPMKYTVRTATSLLPLSTPDFSMPYNVIILTSTVMGLVFGTIFNLMVKKLVPLEELEKQQRTNLLTALKLRIAGLLQRRPRPSKSTQSTKELQ